MTNCEAKQNNYKKDWQTLYRFARSTKSINKCLVGDILSGTIKPHKTLIEMISEYEKTRKRKSNGTHAFSLQAKRQGKVASCRTGARAQCH